MHLRLVRGRFDPAKYDDLLPLTPGILAALEGLPGCQGVYHGVDRATGTTVTVTVWDTEEHARFPRDAVGDSIRRALAQGVQLDPPEFFEVIR